MVLRIGLVGVGKIARDQHIPALAATSLFELAACASHNASVAGVDSFPDLASMLAARPDLDCVSVCTPPQVHFEDALLALRAGKHVLLEKPPAATTRQAALLADEAARVRRTLFQSWHSRFAAAVAPARDWLSGRLLTGGRIVWKEDVRVWHPGQRWIWQPGGFGVFDPGINALSILTEVLVQDVHVEKALLEYPSNRQTPIAADLRLRAQNGTSLSAEFDFRQTGEQQWVIELTTTGGTLRLSRGGAALAIEGSDVRVDDSVGEYLRLYERFAALCAACRSDVDWRPLQLVADALLVGERRLVEPFEE
jgi:predicted dehydrogenase